MPQRRRENETLMTVGTFFVLLMYFGEPVALKEYTIRENLSECLSAKRKINRTLRGGKSGKYNGSVRVECKELEVEHDEAFRITKIISGLN